MAKKRKRTKEEETSYWMSYSDMMAALLLVFVLIITLTMLQAKKGYEDKTNQLEEQKELIAEQEKIMENQQAVMEEQKAQLDKIIGIKQNLIEELKLEFSGTDLKVSVDSQTGAIMLDSSILFDVDKYEIKKSGQEFLEKFLPKYLNVLLNEKYRDYISEIIIEGHTDTNGSYMHNLELSQDRALAVATFCLKDDNSVLSKKETNNLRAIVTANGKSFSNPIYNSDESVNLEKSRRVEFKFRLRDEDMVNEMIEILSEE